MKCAIHQPHYFPWLGYLDKMAKVNRFVLMDEVQLENRSYMMRNRFLQKDGTIQYLTVTAAKKGYREKKYNEIETLDNEIWQRKHRLFLKDVFGHTPYYDEIMEYIMPVFSKEYHRLLDVTQDSILACRDILGIETEIVLQSGLTYTRGMSADCETNERRSNDVLDICKAAGATAYITGTGASLGFLNMDQFAEENIPVAVQDYTCPVYPQRYTKEFVPNISALDMFFNCGVEESRRLFWENVEKRHEFEEVK